MACGLGFGGNNGQVFAHQFVHQTTFTHVGFAHNANEAGLVHKAKVAFVNIPLESS